MKLMEKVIAGAGAALLVAGTVLAGIATSGAASASVATASAASAASPASSREIRGYTFVEAYVNVPAGGQGEVTAVCPGGDVIVGGGGYQGTQGLGEDLNSSFPESNGLGWTVNFNNENSSSDSGVAVAICASRGSLARYSVQAGALVDVPAGGEAQGTVTCPGGTVSLGGGAQLDGDQTYQAMNASAPYGTNGWRAYLGSAGSDSTQGQAVAVCAAKPAGWKQVSSSYVVNPAGAATNVSVHCPKGTKVLGGGPFNSSADPTVTIGLTTSLSSLEGWHSWEDNASSASESVDEWAACAKAVKAS